MPCIWLATSTLPSPSEDAFDQEPGMFVFFWLPLTFEAAVPRQMIAGQASSNEI